MTDDDGNGRPWFRIEHIDDGDPRWWIKMPAAQLALVLIAVAVLARCTA